ncbi:MAG: type IX secretion system sortase PorU [Candidatus Coatesbacteria bacterium]|nr:type IX secretion system sortase PorU [Candidatus Coatesbacteria bacterium]
MKIIACLLTFFLITLIKDQDLSSIKNGKIDNDLKIYQSENSIRIIYKPLPIKKETTSKKEIIYKIKNADLEYEEGKRILPVKKLTIGLPLSRKFTLNYKLKDARSIFSSLPSFYENKKPRNYIENNEVVSMKYSGKWRGINTAILEIHPLIVKKNKLLEYDEIEIEIRFPANSYHKLIQIDEDSILKKGIINYSQCIGWYKNVHHKAPEDPFKKASEWLEICIRDTNFTENSYLPLQNYGTGLYEITYDDLEKAGINPSTLDPAKIQLFDGGHQELIEKPDSIKPVFEEMPIYIDDGNDGKFDKSDKIIFYGITNRGFELDLNNQFSYFCNKYSWEHNYFLAIGGNEGKRVSYTDANLEGNEENYDNDYLSVNHLEKNLYLGDSQFHTSDYYSWKNFVKSGSENEIIRFKLGATKSDADLLLVFYAKTLYDHHVKIVLNNEEILDTTWRGGPGNSFLYAKAKNLKDDNLMEIIVVRDRDPNDVLLFDWFKIVFYRSLDFQDSQKDIYLLPSPDKDYKVMLKNINSEQPFIWETTNYKSLKMLRNGTYDKAKKEYSFRLPENVLGKQRFCVSDKTQLKKPFSIKKYQPDYLRSLTEGAKYYIITPQSFVYYLEPICSYHNETGLKTALIPVEKIYSEIGYGRNGDPTAIRDFLKYAFENYSTKPRYALLVGNGNYDFKNYLGNNDVQYIPPFIDSINHESVEEYFAIFYTNEYAHHLDVSIGRIPVKNINDLKSWVKKSLSFQKDKSRYFGKWRNRALLVADDFDTAEDDTEVSHTRSTEEIYQNYIPHSQLSQKLYMIEYQRIDRYKPEATEDFIYHLNNGCNLFLYFGHGGFNSIAHERLFRIDDISRLNNIHKLPFWLCASCDVADFDNPTYDSLGELTVLKNDGATIATFAASRPTSPLSNDFLFKSIIEYLYEPDTRIGDAISLGKEKASNRANNHRYCLFGDPAQIFTFQKLSFNMVLHPANTIKEKHLSKVNGEAPFNNGMLFITIFDSLREQTEYTFDRSDSLKYLKQPSRIYSGSCEIKNGKFEIEFYSPSDLTKGNKGQVYAYAYNNKYEAIGYIADVIIKESQESSSDTTPPTVKFYYNNQEMYDYIPIAERFTLEIRAEDEHGINMTGKNGQQIVLTIDNDEKRKIDISRYFEYDTGSYRKGRLFYPCYLSSGKHNLKVRASDNFGNTEITSINVNVQEEGFKLKDLLAYPNPMKRYTYLTWLQTKSGNTTIELRTVKGRLIKTISIRGNEGYNQVYWDGKDNEGDSISNGIYFFKVSAIDSYGNKVASIGKLLVVR